MLKSCFFMAFDAVGNILQLIFL
uniref:Uncharacterized protein n=1 Tax=Rhizophora mucronata TaxID=61149 RepID=A0A2P2NDX7_RHIMU